MEITTHYHFCRKHVIFVVSKMDTLPLGEKILNNNQKWYRIAELERISGCPRRTIHFYLKEGLLHTPTKTGKTMAYYDETHLNKLAHIKKAKQQGMPLIGIREQIAQIESKTPNAFGQSISISSQKNKKPTTRQGFPQKSQGKKTRESILDIGCNLFREKGYKETKISEITKALNVGKGTFYFYFSDKKELLLECVPRIFSELFSGDWDLIRQAKNPLERLQQRAQAVLPVLKEFCAIIQLSKEAMEDPDPKIKQLGEQTYISIRTPLESDVEKGIQLGLFKPADPKIVATFLIGIMENLYYLQTTDKNHQAEAIWDSVSDLIINGIRSNQA